MTAASSSARPRTTLATEGHELLLRAALHNGDAAAAAWQEWRTRFDLQHLDSGSTRLLPLVYRNLQSAGVRDAAMPLLRGLHRSNWYRNQLLFHSVTTLLAQFHRAGIKTMLLKGAAMIAAYYRDYGVRPLGDIDVMVPVDQYAAALRVLQAEGWSGTRPFAAFTPDFLWLVHGEHFTHPSGGEIDLHAHLLPECVSPEADRDFWEAARPVALTQLRTTVLDPADQLLHTCVHGIGPRADFLVRWAADATTVLAAPEPVSWPRLIRLARSHGLVLQVRHALRYLKTRLHAPVPDSVMNALDDVRPSMFERIELRVKTRFLPHTAVARSIYFARIMRRQSRTRGSAQALLGLPRTLQHLWAAESVQAVPGLVWRKTMRRIRARD